MASKITIICQGLEEDRSKAMIHGDPAGPLPKSWSAATEVSGSISSLPHSHRRHQDLKGTTRAEIARIDRFILSIQSSSNFSSHLKFSIYL
jgi:hypothetical protein